MECVFLLSIFGSDLVCWLIELLNIIHWRKCDLFTASVGLYCTIIANHSIELRERSLDFDVSFFIFCCCCCPCCPCCLLFFFTPLNGLLLYNIFLDPSASSKHKFMAQQALLFYLAICLLGGELWISERFITTSREYNNWRQFLPFSVKEVHLLWWLTSKLDHLQLFPQSVALYLVS